MSAKVGRVRTCRTEPEKLRLAEDWIAGRRRGLWELVPDGAGARLRFTEQIALLDGGDTAAEREQGWSGLLDQLGAELATG